MVGLVLRLSAVVGVVLALWAMPQPAAGDVEASWGDSHPVFYPTATPTPTALPGGPAGGRGCPGDCGGNQLVTVDELVTGVAIVLGLRSVNDCGSLDDNRDGRVVVNELVAAVSRLLFGCNFTPPTPTNTPAGEQSVCGGPITTVPQVCDLTITPARVRRGGNITLSFGIVDREGDIDTVCAGIGPAGGGTPALECMSICAPRAARSTSPAISGPSRSACRSGATSSHCSSAIAPAMSARPSPPSSRSSSSAFDVVYPRRLW